MNDTANASPPPGNSPDKAKKGAPQKRERSNLDHFRRLTEQDDAVEVKRSIFEVITEAIDGFKSKKKAAPAEEAPARDYSGALKKSKTPIIAGVVLILLVLAALAIAPHIPLQIQRSSGFAAFQERNYTKAYHELSQYAEQRPGDHTAVYMAAQSALFIGDYDYAKQAINSIYTGNRLPQSTAGYHYALLNFDNAEAALKALNAVLQKFPSHAGARLLRGSLLGHSPQSVRQARDDFLQLEDSLRRGEDSSELPFLHRYLQENQYLPPLPPLSPRQGAINSQLATALGLEIGLEGVIYQIQYADSEEFLDEDLQPIDIANLYFAYMLLAQGEAEEATSILTGLVRNAPESLAVQQASAMHSVHQQNYAEAEEKFAALLQRLPTNSKILNNLAMAKLQQGAVRTAAIAEEYRKLSPVGAGVIELNNAAAFFLLSGEYAAAKELLDSAEGISENEPHVIFNQWLRAWANENIEEASAYFERLKGSAGEMFDRYFVAWHTKQNDYFLALDMLGQMQAKQPENADLFIQRVKLMKENTDWRAAYAALNSFLSDSPRHIEADYLLGEVALQLGNENVFNNQRLLIEQAAAADEKMFHYYQALQGVYAQYQGDAAAAADSYYNAMTSAESAEQKLEYAVIWADLHVHINAAEVAAALGELVNSTQSSAVKSLLAYALADAQPAEAVTYAEQAARGGADYRTNLYAGATLLKIGDYARAVPLLEAARRERVGQIRTLSFLRQAYAGAGDSAREQETAAIIAYLRAVAAGEGPETRASYKVYLPRIKALVEAVSSVISGGQDSQIALVAYAAALEETEDPKERADILYSRATFSAYNNEYSRAIALFEEALALGLTEQKNQINALLFYAEVLSLSDRHAEAAKVLRQLIDIDSGSLLYRRLHAVELMNSGDLEGSLRILTDLNRQYPIDISVYSALSNLYTAREEYALAIETSRQLISFAPNYQDAYVNLIELYRLVGNAERARHYSRAYASF